MRILAPQPYISALIKALGVTPVELPPLLRQEVVSHELSLPLRLVLGGDDRVAGILAADPSLIVSVRAAGQGKGTGLEEEWKRLSGKEVEFLVLAPRTLTEVYDTWHAIGAAVHREFEARNLVNRLKAQLADWTNNFYPRMKNKNVLILSSVDPYAAAGWWLPELVRQCGAHPAVYNPGEAPQPLTWREIRLLRPDVVIVAIKGESLVECSRRFKVLEKLEGWEDLPAVKRGEVIFADGMDHFYLPGLQLFESIGIIVSATAGLESGYITPRDLFHRLRWLEMHRHKI